MSRDFSRRRLLAAGAGVAIAGAAAGRASAAADARRAGPSLLGVREERRSLEELYEAAVAEGGKLVLYQGGDASVSSC
ncbi:hypothetical protein ACWCQ1_18210 [Streptomyces sp. NPDC002144]|uniref:hypothetical protein n=1 Tax=Streptomyces sp. NPDC006668 TaxID=3156903 RepID=UPI0033DA7BEB